MEVDLLALRTLGQVLQDGYHGAYTPKPLAFDWLYSEHVNSKFGACWRNVILVCSELAARCMGCGVWERFPECDGDLLSSPAKPTCRLHVVMAKPCFKTLDFGNGT